MASETDIALGVMVVAAGQKSGIASFGRCRRELPKIVTLDANNLQLSTTRSGEAMWHQIVRNIKSHDIAGTNYIAQGLLQHIPRTGYRITPQGSAHLKNLGIHP